MHKAIEAFLSTTKKAYAPNRVRDVVEEPTEVSPDSPTPDQTPARFSPNRAQRRATAKLENRNRKPGVARNKIGSFGQGLSNYFDQKRVVAKLEKQAAAQAVAA